MTSPSKYSALLVDDDSTCTFLTSIVVVESDYFNLPIIFSEPQMALDYIEQNCLRTNPQPFPELMLIDINMPMLNGFEFVEKLKERCADVFDKTLLCFLSSSTNARDKMRAETIGVDFYYSKPLKTENMDELVTTLQHRF